MHDVAVNQDLRAAASARAGADPFASRPEMPVVLRGGTTSTGPSTLLAAPGKQASTIARLPRVVGTIGWCLAASGCAVSVFAVRDTMFTPLGHANAPSAWQAPTGPPTTAGTTKGSPGPRIEHGNPVVAIPTGTTVAGQGSPDVAGGIAAAVADAVASSGSLAPSSASPSIDPAGSLSPGTTSGTTAGTTAGSTTGTTTGTTAGTTPSSTPGTPTTGSADGSGKGKGGSGSGSGSSVP